MYETILVPTDGSDHANRAAEHALALARAFDATVHVLGVVDVLAAAGPFNAGGVDDSFTDTLEEGVREHVAAVERLATDDDAIETATRKGKPAETIVDYAAEIDCELVAMGTHGRTGIHRYVSGSVTERVVRLADVPVFTARHTDAGPEPGVYDDILVPTDGSDPATAAVEHGVSIAAAFDATVHAVSIIDVGDLASRPSIAPPTELLERLREERTEAVDEIAAAARERGVDAVTEVTEGIPARDLLEYTEDNDIDLLTMGTHGRTGINRYLLGSTTERLIRHAGAPVLAVPARELGES
jgi:nucleotide-binding universal stress UspA family protein